MGGLGPHVLDHMPSCMLMPAQYMIFNLNWAIHIILAAEFLLAVQLN